MADRLLGQAEPDEVFARVLAVKARGGTTPLTAEFDALFRASGCEPCCHFCLKPLAVGDEFGFMKLAPGSNGTACLPCIKEKRPPPQVSVTEAETRQTMEKPRGPGFIIYDTDTDL